MIIPMVVMALSLGRSFDIKTVKPGSYYIFEDDTVKKNILTIPRTFTQAQYRFLEDSSDVNSFLNINGELALMSKTWQAKLKGSGDYLLHTINRENTVEILISVYHETVTETFPSYIEPREDWMELPPSQVGTHYIRSIVYGGQLLISYKLTATKSEYLEDIRAAVSLNLQRTGSIDINATGQFRKMEQEIGSKCRLSIDAYATAGKGINPPSTLDQVLALVDEYPSMIKSVNDGKGAPLRLDLVPLSTLNKNYKDVQENTAVKGTMDDATNKFDDLRTAEEAFRNWFSVDIEYPPKVDNMIDKFASQLKEAKKAMVNAISSLDLSAEYDISHFEEAFKIYAAGGYNTPNRYMRWLRAIIHCADNIPINWYPYTKAVTHYIHWGSVNCSLPSPDPLLVGYAALSPKGYGSGGNMQCLGLSPSLDSHNLDSKVKVSRINGLIYETPDNKNGHLYCAYCKLENATSVITIPAKTDCPDEMKLEYKGFLTSNENVYARFVCVDSNLDDANLPTGPDTTATHIHPVWTECPDCEQKSQYVPCVVCSR